MRYARSVRGAGLIAALALMVFGWVSGGVVGFYSGRQAALSAQEFSELIDSLSEPEGFFNSDNFISNESSYLHVMGKLKQLGVSGGVYLGVGPDQNLTYIAKVRPNMAFIVDIRRQNMLEHLIFKALFDFAPTRADFLSMLFSKPIDPERPLNDSVSLDLMVQYFARVPSDENLFQANLARIKEKIKKDYRVKLSEDDEVRLDYVYNAFFRDNVYIQFRSFGRPFSSRYPTLRDLLLETDLEGNRGHFLNSADDYNFLRQMHRRNLIIPVVGDFAGRHAFAAIARYLRSRGEKVSVFYVSNVEFYLLRSGKWEQYVDNVAQLPIDDNSLFIRAYFDYGLPHPEQRPRYWMATVLQRIRSFLRHQQANRYHSYWDVATLDYIPLR